MNLVVGSTGMLGREICRRLRELGEPVRGLVRVGSPLEPELLSLGVEVAHGDLKDRASIEQACSGIDRVISTATAIASRRKGDSLNAVDRDGQLGLVDVAARSGVRHVVFISASPGTQADNPLIRYKRMVEAVLKQSGMIWTVLQPTAFMEIWFSPIAGWDLQKGTVRLVSGGARTNFVSLKDVAAFAVVATQGGMENRAVTIGGPEAFSPLETVRLLEEVTGRTLKVSRAPAKVLRLVSLVLRPFHPPLSSILSLSAGVSRGDRIDMTQVLAEHPIQLTSLRNFFESLVEAT